MINNFQIEPLETLLLPKGCHFAADARAVINCWDGANVLACPGSGKTTVLLAKLKILADCMPLVGGRGICILSHTNVAVDEIKKRLKGDSEKILSYPNFAGTIQSFVDTFIVFPVFRTAVKSQLRVLSRDEYACRAWKVMQLDRSYSALRMVVLNRFGPGKGYASAISVFEKLSLRQGALFLGEKEIAKATSKSATQFSKLNTYLWKAEGFMTYEQALGFASDILKRHGDVFRPLITRRFKYVFIDEYQDCSTAQCRVLDELFNGTEAVVMRIGDVDQAIYNNVEDVNVDPLQVNGKCLEIAETNRYGDEIASVLTKLRTGQKPIISQRGSQALKPVLLVYKEGAEKTVVEAFVNEIRNAGLPKDATYKAIGMVRRGRVKNIIDYWSCFDNDTTPLIKNGWNSYQQEIVRQLQECRLYKVEQNVVELLVLVARHFNIRTDDGKYYNKTLMRRRIMERGRDEFSMSIIDFAVAFAKCDGEGRQDLLGLMRDICGFVFERQFTEDEWAECVAEGSEGGNLPIALDHKFDDGITIQLDTVHGVKGETHEATLYLETVYNKGSDLKRILPLLEDKPFQYEGVYEKSRRCVYVGFSRPRHLLCVAMQKKTYEGHETAFEDEWKVVHLG